MRIGIFMNGEKAAKNRTIDTPPEAGGGYLARCARIGAPACKENIENKIAFGDTFCVMPLLPRGFADLIVADPPYNLTKNYGGNVFARMHDDEYEAYTRRWLSLAEPLLKEGGSIYVCCDWRSSLAVGRVLGEFFEVKNRITWQREKGRGAKANWKNGLEDIWFAVKGKNYTFDLEAVKVRRRVLAPYREGGAPKGWREEGGEKFRDTCPSNFWDDITVPFWSMPENTAHPAQKPEKLYAKLILASSRTGETVFDPFAGSGTAAVVAKKLGRKFFGIEANAQYCIWAQQRLERAEHDKRIQGYDGKVFYERNTSVREKRFTKNDLY